MGREKVNGIRCWVKLLNKIMSDNLNTQSVIIYFNYGLEEMDSIYNLENELEKIITENNVGEFDGHEIAMDNTDGSLYMYGPNAENLFKAIKPILEKTNFMKGAMAHLRFGPPVEGVPEIDFEI